MMKLWPLQTSRKVKCDEQSIDTFKMSQLKSAIKFGNTQLAVKLIRSPGVDVNYSFDGKTTLMHKAVGYNNIKMVQLLLKAGALVTPTIRDASNYIYILSPLWMAILNHNYAMVEVLLRGGADPNERIGRFANDCKLDKLAPPLHAAIFWNDIQFVKLLLNYGSNPNLCDSQHCNSLLYAVAQNASIEIIDLLISRGVSPNSKDQLNRTCLHSAIALGNEKVVDLLLSLGADPTAIHLSGKTALHFATGSKYPSLGIVDKLLTLGLDLEKRERIDEKTPFLFALRPDNEDMIEFLIELGADMTVKTRNGLPALFVAVECAGPDVIEILLAAGVDISERIRDGRTALHLACRRNLSGEAKILLEHGANAALIDERGNTPYSYIQDPQSETSKIMLRHMMQQQIESKRNLEFDLDRGQTYLQSYYCLLEREIEEMKRHKLYDSYTYFYVFTKSEQRVASLLNDSDFEAALSEKRYLALFPNFARQFDLKVKRCRAKNMIADAMDSYTTTEFGKSMPIIVTDQILAYLKPTDLVISQRIIIDLETSDEVESE